MLRTLLLDRYGVVTLVAPIVFGYIADKRERGIEEAHLGAKRAPARLSTSSMLSTSIHHCSSNP
jgi:hypothetical protein